MGINVTERFFEELELGRLFLQCNEDELNDKEFLHNLLTKKGYLSLANDIDVMEDDEFTDFIVEIKEKYL